MTALERIKKVTEIHEKRIDGKISKKEQLEALNKIYNEYFNDVLSAHIKIEEPYILSYLETFVQLYRKNVLSNPDYMALYTLLKMSQETKIDEIIMPNMFNRGIKNDD